MALPRIYRIAISAAASADLVAAVADKRIRVLAFTLVSAGTVTAKFQSGATTDLTGAMSLIAASGMHAAHNPDGHFETAVGAKLNLVLSGSIQVSGWMVYTVVG